MKERDPAPRPRRHPYPAYRDSGVPWLGGVPVVLVRR
jgi:hypothetical protein